MLKVVFQYFWYFPSFCLSWHVKKEFKCPNEYHCLWLNHSSVGFLFIKSTQTTKSLLFFIWTEKMVVYYQKCLLFIWTEKIVAIFYLTKKSYFWTTTFNVTTARFKRPKRMKVPSSFLFFLYFHFSVFSFLFFCLVVFAVLALFWWRHAKIFESQDESIPSTFLSFFLSFYTLYIKFITSFKPYNKPYLIR
jgi:hypothetical protein